MENDKTKLGAFERWMSSFEKGADALKYEDLKIFSVVQRDDEIEYNRFANRDHSISSVEELLFNEILLKKDHPMFEDLVHQFHNEYPNYISNVLEQKNHAIYLIEHEKEYRKVFDIEWMMIEEPPEAYEELFKQLCSLEENLEYKYENFTISSDYYDYFDKQDGFSRSIDLLVSNKQEIVKDQVLFKNLQKLVDNKNTLKSQVQLKSVHLNLNDSKSELGVGDSELNPITRKNKL